MTAERALAKVLDGSLKSSRLSKAEVSRRMNAAGFDRFNATSLSLIVSGDRRVTVDESFELGAILGFDTLAVLAAWSGRPLTDGRGADTSGRDARISSALWDALSLLEGASR